MDNNHIQSIAGNTLFRWGIIASAIFLALFLAVQTLAGFRALPLIGNNVPIINTVTVDGEGEIFAVPDVATFTFSVVEEAATVEEAQNTVVEKMNDMIAFLEREGVEEKDIKTIGFNVNPRYEFRQSSETGVFPPQGNRVLVGFEVRQSIRVKVRDTEAAGTLLSGIGGRGVTDVSGLQFTIDDEEALRAEAREMAIENAQEKAQELADDLDVRIARVVSFHESGQGFSPRFDEFAEFGFGGDIVVSQAAAPELPVGENRIVSRVSVTYEIR